MSSDLVPSLRDGYAQMMFYMREQYWHHGEELCTLMVQTYDDHVFRIWRAFALAQQGFENEAVRELKQLLSTCAHNLTIKCPALMATYLIHKSTRDMESAQQVENELNVFLEDRSEMKSNADGWVEAAGLCFIASEVNRARDILANIADNTLIQHHNNEYTALATLRGWIDLCSGRTALLEKCGSLFNTVLSRKNNNNANAAQLTSYSTINNDTTNTGTKGNSKSSLNGKDDFTAFLPNSLLNSIDIDAALGRIAYFEKKLQFTAALELMNKLIVSAPNATFLLGCKARLLMGAEDWPQCVETVRRILSKESDNIFALSLIILHALVKENRTSTACHYLPLLIDAIEKREPRNAVLCCRFAQAYSRLSGTAQYIAFTLKTSSHHNNKAGSSNSNNTTKGMITSNVLNDNSLDMSDLGLDSHNTSLLIYTMKLAEMAVKLNARNGEFLCELGRQMLYNGNDMKLALATFQRAATLTDGLEPLLGAAITWINLNKWNEASKQIDFCNELQQPNQRNAELSFLNALIAWRYKHDEAKCLSFLDQAADAMRSMMQGNLSPSLSTNVSNAGLDCYVRLNMPLMLAIATEYMQHCRNEPLDAIASSSSSSSSSAQMSFKQQDTTVEKCRAHLLLLLRNVPACSAALLLLAQIHFISGELHDAEVLLKERLLFVGGVGSSSSSITNSSDGSSENDQQHERSIQAAAFLLSAQICQYTNNIALAHAALQQALTVDFTIKEQPYYNLLQGIIQSVRDKPQEALNSFKKAKELFEGESGATNEEIKDFSNSSGINNNNNNNNNNRQVDQATRVSGVEIHPLSVSDHVTLYLQMAQTELKLNNVEGARQMLQSAQTKFKNTLQEGRVTIAQAMLAARQDLDQAINLLRQVPVKSPFYVNARSQLAKLYLIELHHPQKYIACYEEVVEELPSVQALVALGEAYGVIAQYDKAVLAYEKARALAPHNSDLAICIGRLLVSTHDYTNAIHYYTDALANEEENNTNNYNNNSSSSSSGIDNTNMFNVRADLAILYWHLNDMNNAIATLQEASVFVPLDIALSSPQTFDREVEFGFHRDEAMSVAVTRVNCYLLLYKIQRDKALSPSPVAASGLSEVAAQQRHIAEQCLLAAKKYQMHVLDQPIRDESRETIFQQKRIFAHINTELARFYMISALQQETFGVNEANSHNESAVSKTNENEMPHTQLTIQHLNTTQLLSKAEECLTQSLKFDETNEDALLEVIKLHLIHDNIELAEEYVRKLLKINADNEYALLLQAHMLRQRHLEDEAITIYARVLKNVQRSVSLYSLCDGGQVESSSPMHDHYYVILIKYMVLLIKSGKLKVAQEVVEEIEEEVMRHAARSRRRPPGLSYARGICSLAANETSEALRYFNAARFPCDNAFSTLAMMSMVQRYLVPSATEEQWTNIEMIEEQTDNLRAAETLVHQLPLSASLSSFSCHNTDYHAQSHTSATSSTFLPFSLLSANAQLSMESKEKKKKEEKAEEDDREKEGNVNTISNVNINVNAIKQRLCAECLLARRKPTEVQYAMKLLISLLQPELAIKYELNLKDLDAWSKSALPSSTATTHNNNNTKNKKKKVTNGGSKSNTSALNKLRHGNYQTSNVDGEAHALNEHNEDDGENEYDEEEEARRQRQRRQRRRRMLKIAQRRNNGDEDDSYDEYDNEEDDMIDDEEEYYDEEEEEEEEYDEDEDDDDLLLLKSANYRRRDKRHSLDNETPQGYRNAAFSSSKYTSSFTIHTNATLVTPEDVLSVLPCVQRNIAASLDLAIACYLSKEEQLARKVLQALLNQTSQNNNDNNNNNNNGQASNNSLLHSGAIHFILMMPSAQDRNGQSMLLSEEANDEIIERALLFQSFLDAHHPTITVQGNTTQPQLSSAEQCLQQIITTNKSNGVALDALGTIYEQQQRHKEAAHCYEEAWQLMHESDPSVGYKLALSYLKSNDLIKCINICKRVMKLHPNYPHIEEDVLLSAYKMLRS